jgi:mycoredoxin
MDENGVVVYGTAWCGDCRRAKKLLERRSVGYAWVDVEKTKGAREEMLRLNGGDRRVPTILFPDGSVLVEPTNPQLNAQLDEQVA